MDFVNLNGKTLPRDKALLPANDHSYRYGNGLFETIKVKEGQILLADLHFERLFQGLQLLSYSTPALFTKQIIGKEIIALCSKNKCMQQARVRLSVSPGTGGLYDMDENFRYLIEAWPLHANSSLLNENGLVIDIFPSARKSCDSFSGIKSASHIIYAAAARFAKKNHLNDCLVLNIHDRICDSTIANIFWIKNDEIFTPPLSEGAIAGVMRKYLLEKESILEKPCTIHDLESAQEIFLTNAIKGIQWVQNFREIKYTNTKTKEIKTACSSS